tara:strand:+ start:1204 stop:1743 length:540 start_codon:yes stop_codon:yes gene_type:complete
MNLRLSILFGFLFFGINCFSQYGYEPKHTKPDLGGWDTSNEFKKADVFVMNMIELESQFLNKSVTPIYISNEFRENSYKNFYKDSRLKKTIKDKTYRGLRSHASNGSGGTMVLYNSKSNYRILFGKRFKVIEIARIKNKRHISNTDDSNYVFKLQNEELGVIYYKYNSKFKSNVEIELL